MASQGQHLHTSCSLTAQAAVDHCAEGTGKVSSMESLVAEAKLLKKVSRLTHNRLCVLHSKDRKLMPGCSCSKLSGPSTG